MWFMYPKQNSQSSQFSSCNSILAFITMPSIFQTVEMASLYNQPSVLMIFCGFQGGQTHKGQMSQRARKLANLHPILMNPSKKHRKSNPLIKTFQLKIQNQWKLMKKQANTKQQDSWQCCKQKMKILPLNPVNIQMIGQQHLIKIKNTFLCRHFRILASSSSPYFCIIHQPNSYNLNLL